MCVIRLKDSLRSDLKPLWPFGTLIFKPLHSSVVTLHGGISKAKLCKEFVISFKKKYIKMSLPD